MNRARTTAPENEYGPFGEVIRASGPMAKANPFRFSTKYQEDESDLLYYGYRYYNASTGRWLSRDPLGEESFLESQLNQQPLRFQKQLRNKSILNDQNSYGFNRNDPGDSIDILGLKMSVKIEKDCLSVTATITAGYSAIFAALQAALDNDTIPPTMQSLVECLLDRNDVVPTHCAGCHCAFTSDAAWNDPTSGTMTLCNTALEGGRGKGYKASTAIAVEMAKLHCGLFGSAAEYQFANWLNGLGVTP